MLPLTPIVEWIALETTRAVVDTRSSQPAAVTQCQPCTRWSSSARYDGASRCRNGTLVPRDETY